MSCGSNAGQRVTDTEGTLSTHPGFSVTVCTAAGSDATCCEVTVAPGSTKALATTVTAIAVAVVVALGLIAIILWTTTPKVRPETRMDQIQSIRS